ncbi:MAG: NnrS family protein [Gammaproteobacteria bacterium]|nr:NnrS family protein [Gammaproteobacteria bacterium]
MTTIRPRGMASSVFLSMGFRPFFLLAGLWAVLGMGLWLLVLAGGLAPPGALDPLSWHAHEALYGYLGAVLAGFLLTAMPNWTGRPPMSGWPLAALAALWILGRVAILVSEWLSMAIVALIDLSCLVALGGYAMHQVVVSRNWRNLVVVAMVGTLVAGNSLFHWEVAKDVHAVSGYGLRIGLAAMVMMISVIGGRIVPAFTRNWLAAHGGGNPAEFGRFDGLVLALTLFALTAWVAFPHAPGTGFLLLVSGLAQVVRLCRWRGQETTREPLLWILHVGYAFVPLGMLGVGGAILWPESISSTAVRHLWLAGAIGVMTLAVMTRATLGHTGRALTAGMGTTVIYLLVIASVFARVAAGALPGYQTALWTLAATLWCSGFVGFVFLYGWFLVSPSKE